MLCETKLQGETMDQFIKRIKKKHNINKLGYTARLDPMAKGIVPFVEGSECVNIKKYLGTNKSYQVKIIFGLQTDSDDALGLISKQNFDFNFIEIKNLIINYLSSINNSTFKQKFHYFSTKMLNHRRNNNVKPIDSHDVSLFDYKILSESIFDYEKWKNKIIGFIQNIDQSKNFRQTYIVEQWTNLICHKLFYLKIKLDVSSGFFVRQLIRDMSDFIKFPLMCYNINRISVSL